jgi:hypothetical protein
VGPGPFVSGSGEAKGPGAQVVQPDGPSEPHRVTVFATDIQPLPLPVVAMESFLTSVSMFSNQCVGLQLPLPAEGSTASS